MISDSPNGKSDVCFTKKNHRQEFPLLRKQKRVWRVNSLGSFSLPLCHSIRVGHKRGFFKQTNPNANVQIAYISDILHHRLWYIAHAVEKKKNKHTGTQKVRMQMLQF